MNDVLSKPTMDPAAISPIVDKPTMTLQPLLSLVASFVQDLVLTPLIAAGSVYKGRSLAPEPQIQKEEPPCRKHLSTEYNATQAGKEAG